MCFRHFLSQRNRNKTVKEKTESMEKPAIQKEVKTNVTVTNKAVITKPTLSPRMQPLDTRLSNRAPYRLNIVKRREEPKIEEKPKPKKKTQTWSSNFYAAGW